MDITIDVYLIEDHLEEIVELVDCHQVVMVLVSAIEAGCGYLEDLLAGFVADLTHPMGNKMLIMSEFGSQSILIDLLSFIFILFKYSMREIIWPVRHNFYLIILLSDVI